MYTLHFTDFFICLNENLHFIANWFFHTFFIHTQKINKYKSFDDDNLARGKLFFIEKIFLWTLCATNLLLLKILCFLGMLQSSTIARKQMLQNLPNVPALYSTIVYLRFSEQVYIMWKYVFMCLSESMWFSTCFEYIYRITAGKKLSKILWWQWEKSLNVILLY